MNDADALYRISGASWQFQRQMCDDDICQFTVCLLPLDGDPSRQWNILLCNGHAIGAHEVYFGRISTSMEKSVSLKKNLLVLFVHL